MSIITIAKIIEGAYLDNVITSSEYVLLCVNIDNLKQIANPCMSALDYLAAL